MIENVPFGHPADPSQGSVAFLEPVTNAPTLDVNNRNLRLAAHQSVRVHTGIGRDTAHDVYQDRRDYVWNNNGDTATLRDNRGHIAAARSWGRH
ncbi:lamin tail domain-containing protein [Streptomyces sp. NPDC001205]